MLTRLRSCRGQVGTRRTVTVLAASLLALVSSGSAASVNATQAAALSVSGVSASVDLTRAVQSTRPDSLGVVSSTYGVTPQTSVAQAGAEQRLDARFVRIPVGYRNGHVTSSAAGGPATLDVPTLVRQYRSWGFGVLIVIGGRTTDTDVQPGDATRIIQTLGFDGVSYSSPNEPGNHGQSMQTAIQAALMISDEGRRLNSSFQIWGPVWAYYDRSQLRQFAAAMGPRLAGIDYHHYAMGSSTLSTSQALSQTPTWAQEVRDTKADLAALGLNAEVNVDELNFSWRYQDGTAGGNNRFFTAVNTVWMASALGHILQAGGKAMPYATQNGPLGVTVQSGSINPDQRPALSPMPAYWGIGTWTGAGAWPHYRDTFYAASTNDASTEVFAVNNEAGGYNLVTINKSESATKNVSLAVHATAGGAYTSYVTDPAAPYTAPKQRQQGTYAPHGTVNLNLPPMTVSVLVLAPGLTPPVASPPTQPQRLSVTRSAAGDTAVLAWQPPTSPGTSPLTGYKVSRNGLDTTASGADRTILPANAASFTFSLLDKATTYTVTVAALNAAGAGPAAAAVAVGVTTTPTVPTAPTSLSVLRTPAGDQVTLSWQPPTTSGGSAVTSYRISRTGRDTTGGGAYSIIRPATDNSFRFTLLDPAAVYTFAVQAINAVGSGPATTITR